MGTSPTRRRGAPRIVRSLDGKGLHRCNWFRVPKNREFTVPVRKRPTMTAFSPALFCSASLLLLVGSAITTSATPMASADPSKAQITILYDAFGKDSAMQKDWGYAALVEYGGKRILFDTGNNPEVLAQNAKAKSIDLSTVGFVVMSHR